MAYFSDGAKAVLLSYILGKAALKHGGVALNEFKVSLNPQENELAKHLSKKLVPYNKAFHETFKDISKNLTKQQVEHLSNAIDQMCDNLWRIVDEEIK